MSSSNDSVSLSSSSSESMESGRSIGRHVEEESTSPAAMVGRIPMETVTEVREDPLEEIAESNGRPRAVMHGWLLMFVTNRLCFGGLVY